VVFFCISENGKLYLKKRAGIGYSSCLVNIDQVLLLFRNVLTEENNLQGGDVVFLIEAKTERR
jgi:hypothetical protein